MRRTTTLLFALITASISSGCARSPCERVSDSQDALVERVQTCRPDVVGTRAFDVAACEQKQAEKCTEEQAELVASYVECAFSKGTCENYEQDRFNEEVVRCAQEHKGMDLACLEAILNK
ncbi:hypothetical protein [Archangium sp.]|uniref:hypothetical protein n=1 Tax=Archangium sp. TaxID=1872627 RepID=UPI002ED77166